jgi:hypothetical protein
MEGVGARVEWVLLEMGVKEMGIPLEMWRLDFGSELFGYFHPLEFGYFHPLEFGYFHPLEFGYFHPLEFWCGG